MSYPPQNPPAYQQQQPTIVIMQGSSPSMYTNEWNRSLFDFDNCLNCVIAYFCGPCTMATTRTEFDGSDWCFNCMCIGLPAVRSAIRHAYKIKSDDCTEGILGNCLCMPCSIAQLRHEVSLRGRMPRTTQVPKEGWNVGMFDMFRDCSVFMYGLCCPQCAIAQARQEYDSTPCCQSFCCQSPVGVRSIIRVGYNIEGGCCGDILATACCLHCVACQLLNEVRARGPNNGPHIPAPPITSQPKF